MDWAEMQLWTHWEFVIFWKVYDIWKCIGDWLSRMSHKIKNNELCVIDMFEWYIVRDLIFKSILLASKFIQNLKYLVFISFHFLDSIAKICKIYQMKMFIDD